MKKFLKMCALMLLAGALVVGFASCSNGSDDSSSSSSSNNGTVVATFKRTDANRYFKFYENKNFSYFIETSEVRKGSYEIKSGDWTNGSVEIKPVGESAQTLTISSSSFEYDNKTFAKQ